MTHSIWTFCTYLNGLTEYGWSALLDKNCHLRVPSSEAISGLKLDREVTHENDIKLWEMSKKEKIGGSMTLKLPWDVATQLYLTELAKIVQARRRDGMQVVKWREISLPLRISYKVRIASKGGKIDGISMGHSCPTVCSDVHSGSSLKLDNRK